MGVPAPGLRSSRAPVSGRHGTDSDEPHTRCWLGTCASYEPVGPVATAHRRMADREPRPSFIVATVVTLIGHAAWAAMNGGTLPEFTAAGLFKQRPARRGRADRARPMDNRRRRSPPVATASHEAPMTQSPRAGQPALPSDLVDVDALLRAYADIRPDPSDPTQRVAFG